MKIKWTLAVALLCGTLFTACDEECISGSGTVVSQELNVPPFQSLALLGSAEVIIREGNTQLVEVEGQQNIINLINTDVRGGHWDIFTEGCVRNSRGLTYYITVPNLELIGLSGSGNISTENTLNSDELSLVLSGSGRIDVRAECSEIISNITGSGVIRIAGTAEDAQVMISGSGGYQGFELETETTRVNISGSGDADVTVSELLQAIITGSGNVIYRGNPTVDTNITGSGTVRPD